MHVDHCDVQRFGVPVELMHRACRLWPGASLCIQQPWPGIHARSVSLQPRRGRVWITPRVPRVLPRRWRECVGHADGTIGARLDAPACRQHGCRLTTTPESRRLARSRHVQGHDCGTPRRKDSVMSLAVGPIRSLSSRRGQCSANRRCTGKHQWTETSTRCSTTSRRTFGTSQSQLAYSPSCGCAPVRHFWWESAPVGIGKDCHEGESGWGGGDRTGGYAGAARF